MLAITLFTLPIFVAKSYNNLYYAYTNKRLIVRHGTFGVSFNSIDYKDITATAVNVGAFDKKHNTGSLTFSGPGFYERRPIQFEFIEDPYEEMKSIKEYIDMTKK